MCGQVNEILFCLLVLQVTEVENDMSPVQEEEGPNAVSQLARKVCEPWQCL